MDDGQQSAGSARGVGAAARAALRRFVRETDAGPIVEFAVVVPALLLLLTGVVDFARAYYTQNALVAAAREGARFLSVQEFPCSTDNEGAARGRVRAAFVGFGTAKPDSTTTMIPISYTVSSGSCTSSDPSKVKLITVEIVGYQYSALLPVYRIFKGSNSVNLSAKAVYRWERASE